MEGMDLIAPPIGMKPNYNDVLYNVLKRKSDELEKENKKLFQENSNLRKLLVSVLTQTGTVVITSSTLNNVNLNYNVHTTYDARDETVKVEIK